ncbi:phosphate acyltransferase PlsX [Alphaproteobacteria bacterium]|nr:phosphate acyltransferase PlsX [Alphaproteobacteria bacterium]
MSLNLRIALDAMGGDNAPEIVIDGASLARERHPDLQLTLIGDSTKISELTKKYKNLSDVKIIHADDMVAADEKPSQALRHGKKTSMWLAVNEVALDNADAIISAGNTGALMAISKLQLRMISGVTRPAIAGFLPTLRGLCCMLDLGANIEVDERNLVQFGIMGASFCEAITGKQNPSVGILNVGEEDQKGFDYLRLAGTSLSHQSLNLNYVGFIEGSDIVAGDTDVIVTDGFTGNVALKTAEGTAKFFMHHLRQAFQSTLLSKLGFIFSRGALLKMRRTVDPRYYNGAVLLGLNGICVKSHGGADSIGFSNAIEVACNLVKHEFIPKVSDSISEAEKVIQSKPE